MSAATAIQAPPLLEARGLSAGYGGRAAVRELDLHVAPGEVVALLGANGAGKTTTILTLAGELEPLAGEVHWRGEARKASLTSRARTGLSLITEERSVFMGLTVAENLRLGRGAPDAALELFPELEEHLARRVGLLSGGQQQILAVARALAARPEVLLADELSLGLAPLVVQRLLAAVRKAADEGVGVLLVEQQVRKALEIADRVCVLQRGRLVLQGTSEELRGRMDEVEQSYLAGPVG
ncbi:MAG TPA: ATP-binding cassette domain-containing protein [Baekduia sp.]|nr:ATP-binding cassette domain-containing protein [Baekduia sp.]